MLPHAQLRKRNTSDAATYTTREEQHRRHCDASANVPCRCRELLLLFCQIRLLRANNERRASGDGLVGWWPWLGLWAPLVGILDGWRAQPLRFETGGFRQTTRTTVQPSIVRNTGVDWSPYVGCRLPGALNLAALLSPMGFVMNLLSVEELCTIKYGALIVKAATNDQKRDERKAPVQCASKHTSNLG